MNRYTNDPCDGTYSSEIVDLLNEFGISKYDDINNVINIPKLSKWKWILRKQILDKQCEKDWKEIETKTTTNRCLNSIFKGRIKKYKRMNDIFDIVDKFRNRIGVKWYFVY